MLTSPFSILDGDVEDQFKLKYVDKGLHKNLNVAFLPIQSAEKFLKSKLIDNVDHKFFRHFNDCFFHKKSLDDLIQENKTAISMDKKGKILFNLLQDELNKQECTYDDVMSKIVEYIIENENMETLKDRIKMIFE